MVETSLILSIDLTYMALDSSELLAEPSFVYRNAFLLWEHCPSYSLWVLCFSSTKHKSMWYIVDCRYDGTLCARAVCGFFIHVCFTP